MFGQVYLRARYYAPGLGRFTAPDPLVIAAADLPMQSPYVYGRDNPLLFTDPSGLTGQTNNSVYVPSKTDGPKAMAFDLVSGSGATEGLTSNWQLDPVEVSGAVTSVKKAMEWVRQAGKAGEEAFAKQFPGFVRNTQTYITEHGNVRPDYVSKTAMVEVKKRAYQALTNQLKGEIEATLREGKQYILAVREGYTRLASTVINAIEEAGGAIVYYTLEAADVLKDAAGKIGPGIEVFPAFILDSPEFRKLWDPFYARGTT